MLRLLFLVSLFAAIASVSVYACPGSPAGTSGDVTYNNTHNVPMYCDGTNWIAMSGGVPGGPYQPIGVELDNDRLQHTSANPSDFPQTKRISGSFWYKAPISGGAIRVLRIESASDASFIIVKNTVNQLRIQAKNSANTDILSYLSRNVIGPQRGWINILFSFDLATPGSAQIYIDDVDELASNSIFLDEMIADNISRIIFNSPNTLSADHASYADFWIDWDRYIDFSIEENRRKFISAAGEPVFLGNDGSLPFGESPVIFLSGAASSWHTNKGTAGGFTIGTAGGDGILENNSNPPVASSNQIVPNGLMGHWRLDEKSGITAVDSSGNGNHGIFNRDFDTYSVPGIIGRGVSMSANGNVTIPDSVSLSPTAEITVSAWVRRNIDTNRHRIVSKWADNSYMLWLEGNGQPRFEVATTNNQRIAFGGTSIANDSNWHHVLGTYDGANLRVYLNGILEDSRGLSGNIINSSANIIIGYGNGGQFRGDVDDVRIYNRALTQPEITELYQARDGMRYNPAQRTMEFFDQNKWVSMTPEWRDVRKGLVGHWKLDETSGTTVSDSSGNSLEGTMRGGMNGASSSSKGAVGPALSFDGVDDDILFSPSSLLDDIEIDNDGMTVSAWINPISVSGEPRIIQKGDHNIGVGEGDWFWRIRFNTLEFQKGFTTTILQKRSSSVLSLNKWQHVLITWDGSANAANVHMYIDGVETGYSTAINGDGIKTSDSDRQLAIGSEVALPGIGTRKFHGKIDDVRIYNRVLSSAEVGYLFKMGTHVGSVTALPQGCPTIGDVCDDGTIYAGLSPDGIIEMYAAPSDEAGTYQWGSYGVARATVNNDGDGNTALLSRSGENAHPPAYRCANKSFGGSDDWYMPALSELDVLYNSGNPAVAGLNLTGSQYWSSNQHDNNSARARRFNVSGSSNTGKNAAFLLRCVRKGPAPRCANPYGVEGSIVYNTDHDVMQYCDGARWRAIGKSGP